MAIADALPPSDGVWPGLDLLERTVCGRECRRLLFLDLETTGLAGGAGTRAFLVGFAWFDGSGFRTRQFFLSSLAAEAAMLTAVSQLAEAADALVTFNGKTFDLPLLEMRYAFHRRNTALLDLPHVDLLHPARRVWKPPAASGPEGGCRLTTLERAQCGLEREGDVPGFEIPARFFGYVRTGDARPLVPVLEHNRLDLLSLAILTSKMADLVASGPGAAETAREALGMGRLFEVAGRPEEARRCYERAVGCAEPDPVTAAEALHAHAVACRQARRHEEAANAWARLIDLPGCPARLASQAGEALAIHHEHRVHDATAARALAWRSLQQEGSLRRQVALRYRLARLDRKIGGPLSGFEDPGR